MAVFRDVEIEWGGVDYTVTPSNKLLRKIESKGDVSLTAVASKAADGNVQMSVMSFILAELLASAGARPKGKDTLEDEIYREMIHGGEEKTVSLAQGTMLAIMPQEQSGKKPEAQSDE